MEYSSTLSGGTRCPHSNCSSLSSYSKPGGRSDLHSETLEIWIHETSTLVRGLVLVTLVLLAFPCHWSLLSSPIPVALYFSRWEAKNKIRTVWQRDAFVEHMVEHVHRGDLSGNDLLSLTLNNCSLTATFRRELKQNLCTLYSMKSTAYRIELDTFIAVLHTYMLLSSPVNDNEFWCWCSVCWRSFL